eukprot:CAMPEP_0179005516 /NCGR_PEP_ID=MMETSP0795-20121207/13987_1 /TAXON_ID=88552 /ORGANISM="Amoebophrya sp., Strain Ameob2" /LENGTH=1946 /DNA_ID=CAMNT_0020700065 /DNA_START=73 /DNA_END=5913 /DNA_ORIENTATION=-
MNPYAPSAPSGASGVPRPGSAKPGGSLVAGLGSGVVGPAAKSYASGLVGPAAKATSSGLVGPAAKSYASGLVGPAAKGTASVGLVGPAGKPYASTGLVGPAAKSYASGVAGAGPAAKATPSGVIGPAAKAYASATGTMTIGSASSSTPGLVGLGPAAKSSLVGGLGSGPGAGVGVRVAVGKPTMPGVGVGATYAGAGAVSPMPSVKSGAASVGVSPSTGLSSFGGTTVGGGASSSSAPRGSVVISQFVDDSKNKAAGVAAVATQGLVMGQGVSGQPSIVGGVGQPQFAAPAVPPQEKDAALSFLEKVDQFQAEEERKKSAEKALLKVGDKTPLGGGTPRDTAGGSDEKGKEGKAAADHPLSPMSFADSDAGQPTKDDQRRDPGNDSSNQVLTKALLGNATTQQIPNLPPLNVAQLRRGSLHFHVFLGQFEHAEFLLREAENAGDKFFVNAIDTYGGRSALHVACIQGEAEIAELLIAEGGDLQLRDTDLRTCLHYACYKGATKIARMILGNALKQLRQAAVQKFRRLRLEAPGYDPTYADEAAYERTVAFQCCSEYLKNLEDLRYRLFSSEDEKGMTPLHYCVHDAWQGCLSTLSLLLLKDALVEPLPAKQAACGTGNRNDILSKKPGPPPRLADNKYKEDLMQDPRYQASGTGAKGGSSNSFVDFFLKKLLPHEIKALKKGHKERSAAITDELLNGPDCFGYTLLHHCAAGGNYRGIHCLLQKKADVKARTVATDGARSANNANVGKTAFELAKDAPTKKALQQYFAATVKEDSHADDRETFRERTLSGLSSPSKKSPSKRSRANSSEWFEADERNLNSFLADPAIIARKQARATEEFGDFVNEERGLMGRNSCHAALFSCILHKPGGSEGFGQSVTFRKEDEDVLDGGAGLNTSGVLRDVSQSGGSARKASGAETMGGSGSGGSALETLLDMHPETNPWKPDASGWTCVHYAAAHGKFTELRTLLRHSRRHLHDPSDAVGRNDGLNSLWEDRTGSASKALASTGRLEAADKAIPIANRPPANPNRPKTAGGRLKSAGIGGMSGGTSFGLVTNAKKSGEGGFATSSEALTKRTPTHVAAQGAAKGHADVILSGSSHVRCLEILEEEKWLQLETRDDHGRTPILAAAAKGATASVHWLIQKSANVYAKDHSRNNILHLALQGGHVSLTRLLAYYDADRSVLSTQKNCRGLLPSQVATANVKPEDYTTIWEAARKGDLDKVRAAMRIGNEVDAVSPSGWTPLMYACAAGHAILARFLLSCNSSDLRVEKMHPLYGVGGGQMCLGGENGRAHKGRHPIHLAAEFGHPEICILLKDLKGTDLNLPCDDLGKTPLMYACSGAKVAAVDALLKLPQVDLFAADKRGRTCLHHIALAAGEGEAVRKKDPEASQVLKCIVNLAGVKKASALWTKSYARSSVGAGTTMSPTSDVKKASESGNSASTSSAAAAKGEKQYTALDEIKELDELRHGASSTWKSKTQNMMVRLGAFLKEETRKRAEMMKDLDEKAGYQIERIQEYERSGVVLPKEKPAAVAGATSAVISAAQPLYSAQAGTAPALAKPLQPATAPMLTPSSNDVSIINSLAAKAKPPVTFAASSSSAASATTLINRATQLPNSAAVPRPTATSVVGGLTAASSSSTASGVAAAAAAKSAAVGGSLVARLGLGGGATATTASAAVGTATGGPVGKAVVQPTPSAAVASKPVGLVAGLGAAPATAKTAAWPGGAGLVSGLVGPAAKQVPGAVGVVGPTAKASVASSGLVGPAAKQPTGVVGPAAKTGIVGPAAIKQPTGVVGPAAKQPTGVVGPAAKQPTGIVGPGANAKQPPGLVGPAAKQLPGATSAAKAKVGAKVRSSSPAGSDKSYGGSSFLSESIEIGSDSSSDSPIIGGGAKAKPKVKPAAGAGAGPTVAKPARPAGSDAASSSSMDIQIGRGGLGKKPQVGIGAPSKGADNDF